MAGERGKKDERQIWEVRNEWRCQLQSARLKTAADFDWHTETLIANCFSNKPQIHLYTFTLILMQMFYNGQI